MATPSPTQDEKSAMNFVDDAIDLDCLDWSGSNGPSSFILQAPASSPESPPPSSSSPSKQAPSLRANNYRAFLSSGSLTSGPLVPGSSLGSPSSRKLLPEIALDLSSSSLLSAASSGSSPSTGTSSSSGHVGVNSGVSLPSPSLTSSQQPEAKKKPFLMASLAIGLNEVVPGNDDDDDNDDGRDTIQPKASPGRSPKKFQLGVSQKSPSYALAPSPKSGGSPTGGNGSKLLPISLGGGFGGNGSGGGNSHAMLKFDPIMGSGGGSSRNLDLEAGAKSPCSYRKTIASRSPLRDRSMLGSVSDSSDFVTGASPKSNLSSFSNSSPSKLDPLETESIRGSTFTPNRSATSSSAFPSERKSTELPSSSSSPLHSPGKAQQSEQKQSDSKTTTTASPDKPPAVAQPKFRSPFKKGLTPTGDKSQKETSFQGDDIDLLGDAHYSSMAQAPVPALTPMDEFNYLSFSPRPGGNSGKQTARDLPSLSLSSDAKDNGASGGTSAKQQQAATPSPKKTKKSKDKHQQQEPEQAK